MFLQAECDAKAQSTKDYEQVLKASSVPGLSGHVHPLHVRSQKAKRLSQSTSHAETLSQLSCTAVAETVAMRFTDMFLAWSGGDGIDIRRQSLHHGTPTLEKLMEADLGGLDLVPVDSWTDCLDLLELTTGLKGVLFRKTAIKDWRYWHCARNALPDESVSAIGCRRSG